jgi:Short C-terminal domain
VSNFLLANDIAEWIKNLSSESEPGQDVDDSVLDIPEQIQKLADLRDRGLITPEEFETKKKDLLDRM